MEKAEGIEKAIREMAKIASDAFPEEITTDQYRDLLYALDDVAKKHLGRALNYV